MKRLDRLGTAPRAGMAGAGAILLLGLAGCFSFGYGSGSLSPEGNPVTFSWTSKDKGVSGNMTAKLGKGVNFSGPFLQVKPGVGEAALAPMWAGWEPGWADWDGGPSSTFISRYTGRVIANLSGPNGERMRCRFRLNSASAGIGNGGQGDCQFLNGTKVDAVLKSY